MFSLKTLGTVSIAMYEGYLETAKKKKNSNMLGLHIYTFQNLDF